VRRVATVRAFAKVNLGLRILDRRPDGYHDLLTVFQTVSLADRLEISFEESGGPPRAEVLCNDPQLAMPENLAARAALALLERRGAGGSVQIRLRKRLPAGAGLGGGSSDAGATLRALAVLLRPAPTRFELWEAACAVGSDAPFFLTGGRAIGAGRGELIYPLPDGPREWLVLLAPPVHVATSEAYKALSEARGGPLTQDRKLSTINSFGCGIGASGVSLAHDLAGVLSNDFEDVILRRLPELQDSYRRLQEVGARLTLMSGSGSSFFGLFGSRREALEASGVLREEGFRAFAVSTLSRKAYNRSLELQPA
jgi:4-diphosphocytidyl-2-C-methyl-D-erythritol kinase